jgi:aminopeptidase N
MRRDIGLVASVLALVMALPGVTAAQQRPSGVHRQPEDVRGLHEYLARGKAERLAAFRAGALQTQNQSDYDVIYYGIDLDLDPSTSTITGSVEMTAEVVATSLSDADLNLLDNMTVTQVSVPGSGSVAFTHANSILSISLDRTYTVGESFTVVIEYNGSPASKVPSYYFEFDEYNGQPMIWSLSEPFGARSWWPCKDMPSDKADSVDMRVTIPAGLIVASNGALVSVTNNGATDTYWWHEGYPITTYLVSVAIYPYATLSHWYHYSPTDSMEVRHYVFPDHYVDAQPNLAKTVSMIEAYASMFGEYPFLQEKYGHAEFLWGGGMEHQTITSIVNPAIWWGEYLIAHELAHMWWGDMITCDDFHHIWLNEGFATYTEALWSEYTYGQEQYFSDMLLTRWCGGGTVYVWDTTDVDRIFDPNLSYNKGSWVPHMLRHVVGDATFFDILHAYYADTRYQYGTATTEQFRDVCEDVSGMDLDFFFHQWIYEEFVPKYEYDWVYEQNGDSWDLEFTINQTQTHTDCIFKMPLDILIQTVSGDTTLAVWDSLATQDFAFTIPNEPTGLQLDPNNWVLCTKKELPRIGNPTFDRGILVVNGVNFNQYGLEAWGAYQDSVFWGDHQITFWDGLDETGLGYPPNLPEPLGHGGIPDDTLKQFSSVVWVGNNYEGDITYWNDTSLFPYIEAGGNVLLICQRGQTFVPEASRDYLGITWRESETVTLYEYASTYPGLSNMASTNVHESCAVFDTMLATSESKLLFKDTMFFSTDRGEGVIRIPAQGGAYRADGGRFAFISGRPYRFNHDDLRGNVQFILDNFFGEPYTPVNVAEATPHPVFAVRQNYPNPFNPHTTIAFTVPKTDVVTVGVYDVAGRKVAILANRVYTAGAHSVTWDGTDTRGQSVSSGIYFYRVTAGRSTATRKMILLR